MQPYTLIHIHPALRQLVESIFVMNFDFGLAQLPSVYRYPCSARTHLFLTLGDEPLLVKTDERNDFTVYPYNFIVGPRLVNEIINLGIKRHVVGITFRAGALQRLIGLPMYELTNNIVDATLVFGKEFRVLVDQLKDAKSNTDVQNVIENFLLNKMNSMYEVKPFDLAITELVKQNGNIPVKKIVDHTGLSLRQFERNCLERLGLSPKTFSRLTRFAWAYVLKESNPDLSWAGIAYEAGYSDQTHLIRDFKAFSGYAPTAIDTMHPSNIKVMTALEGIY